MIADDNYNNSFSNGYSTNTLKKKNSLETDVVFKRECDLFNLKSKHFIRSKKPHYTSNWLGGFPMLYDSNKQNVYYDSSDAHSLVLGSTGSKKSRLIVMPSVYLLGAAGESMIISDPKAEIFERTSGYLEKNGYKIFVINLRKPEFGNAWNPFYIPYQFYQSGEIDKAYEQVNDIAYNLTLADISEKDPFWDYSAGDLLSGLILLLMKFCKLKNFSAQHVNIENLLQVRKVLFDEETNNSSLLWSIVEEDTVISSALYGTKTAPEKTKSSILCTFDEKIRFLAMSRCLIDMLSDNDFDISEIRYKKSAIFLIVPDEKTTYHRIVSMFIKQSYEFLIYKSHQHSDETEPFIRINYILDEFSSLPAIRDFPSMISAARSRSIRYMLVIQSQHQLVSRYGDESYTIMANCLNWYFLTSREIKLLEYLSALCGNDDKGKPLIPIYNLQRLNKEKGECIILSGRLKPFLSCLIDIDKYDNMKYDSIKLNHRGLNKRGKLTFTLEINESVVSNQEHKDKQSLSDLNDIQKELERKFDELFGNQ